MDSDFVTEEPKDLEGMVKLYKNIAKYLGTKETNFDRSVPTYATLVPIKQVHFIHKYFNFFTNDFSILVCRFSYFQFCDTNQKTHKVDLYFLSVGENIIRKLNFCIQKINKVKEGFKKNGKFPSRGGAQNFENFSYFFIFILKHGLNMSFEKFKKISKCLRYKG